MKKRFFIQAGLTTLLFFLFFNLFGGPFSSVLLSEPLFVDFDHEWKTTPTGSTAIKGTYTGLRQTGDASFKWEKLYCPNGFLFDCSIKTCVPEALACGCFN